MYEDRIRETLPRVRERIGAAELRAGRDAGVVRLVAVTKTHPIEAVDAAVGAGLGDIGENRVQELLSKRALRPSAEVRWHMIGHVQSRKGASLVGQADLIHSVDSLKLARRISTKAVDEGATVHVLVQVNTSGEAQKSGIAALHGGATRAVESIHEIAELPGIAVDGLMTMAPFVAEEVVLRGCFAGLRKVSEEARATTTAVGAELSMGMTNDLEYAIEEGSTMVRVGTALFGPRPTGTPAPVPVLTTAKEEER